MQSQIIGEWAKKNGIAISQLQWMQLQMHHDMVLETNRHVNLTAITEPQDFAVKHIIDSLTALKHIPQGAGTLADIGTGAGFPGIVLAIMRPHIPVVLLDSLLKRVNFLQDVVHALGLENVKCLHARAEEFARTEEKFDVCIARAVASIDKLAKWVLPMVATRGIFLAMKGPNVQDEIAKAQKMLTKHKGVVRSIEDVELPGGIKHSIVVVGKV